MFNLPTFYDPERKIWRGLAKTRIFNDEISLGQAVMYMMRCRNPEDTMQISDNEGITLTFGQVLTMAIRIAKHLRGLQLTADDIVGVFAPNTSYVMPAVLGSWFNGCPVQATHCNSEPSK